MQDSRDIQKTLGWYTVEKIKPKYKNVLIGMLCFVVIAGVLMIIMPVFLKPQYQPDIMNKLRYSGENVIVIAPSFTEAAYGEKGFYNYYDGTCGMECLTIPLQQGRPDRWGSYNLYTIRTLASLGYPIMNDSLLHQIIMVKPNYLNKYDTVILFHSEYVTKELYQAITHHRHVIYMAPNALYAEINYDYTILTDSQDELKIKPVLGDKITLVRGHNYPAKEIRNAFDWKYDNSNEEYDTSCLLWKFRKIDNGEQLNCAQEIFTKKNPAILLKMKELITP